MGTSNAYVHTGVRRIYCLIEKKDLKNTCVESFEVTLEFILKKVGQKSGEVVLRSHKKRYL